MSKNSSKFGRNPFAWFFGIVEDVNDPLQVGRVRVRAYEWHTFDYELLPSDELPWAHVIMPATSASFQSKGSSPTFLRQGSTVFGFFADGGMAQRPVIMGSLPGIPQEDPDQVDSTDINIDLHDVNELARGINKLADSKAQVGIDEFEAPPSSTFVGKYPHNKVFESELGHVVEFDDSPENPRIHIYHNSGHYTEMVPGMRTDKVNGDHIEISMRDRYIKVRGNFAMVVEGTTSIQSKGAISMTSEKQISMSAPLINISGQIGTTISGGAALSMSAMGVTMVRGSLLYLNPKIGGSGSEAAGDAASAASESTGIIDDVMSSAEKFVEEGVGSVKDFVNTGLDKFTSIFK